MATNPDTYYGVDIACIADADELFSEVSGIALVAQDMIHRLTVTSILGPDGDDWGYDCRTLLGAQQETLTRMQPTIVEVVTRDDRVLTADVTLTSVTHNGLSDIQIRIEAETEFGPFTLTSPISELTTYDLEHLNQ
jgi:hypothetical protein